MMAPVLAPALLAMVTVSLVAQQSPPPPATQPLLVWNAEARRHVAAAIIARGVLRVDRDAVAAAATGGDYVSIDVEVQEMVHGAEARTVRFRHFVPPKAEPRPELRPDPDELLALDGTDRVVFLSLADKDLYLVDNLGTAIALPERELLARLKQREVLHRKLQRLPIPIDATRQAQVAGALATIVADREQQRQSFAAMVQLGRAALPEIIAAMNDRRLLPERELTLANAGAGAFEGQRHYRPKRVVDGVTAVLNELTGESFGFLGNGARDEERDAAVQAWTIYAHYQLGTVPPADGDAAKAR
ncbi:MAG: hypothetical protein IPK26_03265 [Planctomycetes bacterium]|nr:hypothetical protein [Planctomycetota bacterium]